MTAIRQATRNIVRASVAVGLMLAGGCATFAPEDPDLINDRLRPGSGLLSGPGGEFVLLPPTEDPAKPKAD